ncbi:hypothetical protein COHA_004043 [Chlorella ohadii]|uniref:peptidylprolyl isomerase n=1 Tax=Chlorella ohadii TaxID=2649997 RepID=A0AAD5H310_9CHLO|nr:hypothetical protein COHA_004043 [Chlorella ohadii]
MSAQVRASHLLVKHRDSRRPSSWKEATVTRSPEEALAMVQQFRQQIAASPDVPAAFAELASRESHCGSARSGGDLGWFGRGQMQQQFEDVAFGLQAAQQRAAARPAARPAVQRASVRARVAAPEAPERAPESPRGFPIPAQQLPELITKETVRALEAELDNGAAIAALRRFNDNLAALPADSWEAKLRPVMHELAYNLESFNPAFTAVLLKVQSTIGLSDYVRRDQALKHLIQPLAGEYGMHNNEPQARTHRELFSIWYADLLKEPLEDLLAAAPRPAAAERFFHQMMRDINGACEEPVQQACYAMGYNLAIEYLADYEKTWMLDSFRALNQRVLAPAGRPLTEWVFLEVHAEGEAEHAAIGHEAVVSFVPAEQEAVLRRAIQDHDRDMAAFYNHLADLLQ